MARAALAAAAGSGASVLRQGCGAPGTPPASPGAASRALFPADAGAGAELGRKLAIKR